MPITRDDSISHGTQCKICNMIDIVRKEIQDLILSSTSYAKIAEMYPGISAQNVRNHWRLHMEPQLKVETHKQIEAESVKRRDSLIELTKLFDEIDELIIKGKSELHPEESDFTKRVNALRGLINAKKSMIALNARLLGDDQMHRDSMDIVSALKQASKTLAKETVTLGEKENTRRT